MGAGAALALLLTIVASAGSGVIPGVPVAVPRAAGPVLAGTGAAPTATWGPPALHFARVPSLSPAPSVAAPFGVPHAQTPSTWATPAMPIGPGGFSGGMHCSSRMTRMMANGEPA